MIADVINREITELRLEPIDLSSLFTDGLTPLESVERFLSEQLHLREQKAAKMRTKRAMMPPMKTIEEFDFGFQRSVTKEQMLRLCDFTWVEDAYNIMFLGPPSVGKTHLATALGLPGSTERLLGFFPYPGHPGAVIKNSRNSLAVEESLKHHIQGRHRDY